MTVHMAEQILSKWDSQELGTYALAVLRIVFGFMLIWAFFDKLFGLGMQTTPEAAIINGGSPTEYYLTELVSGVFANLFHSLAGNPILDFLLMAGLLVIGIALLAGFVSKLATIGMCVMMFLMYLLSVPPSDNPLVDYHIAYIIAMIAICLLGGFDKLSINGWWNHLGIVQRFQILQ